MSDSIYTCRHCGYALSEHEVCDCLAIPPDEGWHDLPDAIEAGLAEWLAES